MVDTIIFTDMARSEEKERQRLRERLSILERRKQIDLTLDPELKKELREIRIKLRDELDDQEGKDHLTMLKNDVDKARDALKAAETTASDAKKKVGKAEIDLQVINRKAEKAVKDFKSAQGAALTATEAADAEQDPVKKVPLEKKAREAQATADQLKQEKDNLLKAAENQREELENLRHAAQQARERIPILQEDFNEKEMLVNKYQEAHLVDPFFLSIHDTLKEIVGHGLGIHKDGKLPSQQAGKRLTDDERIIAAAFGLLELDNQINPKLDRFVPSVSSALGEYTRSKKLFDNVLSYVAEAGDTGSKRELRADQWVSVVRTLRDQRIGADDPQLKLLTQRLLGNQRDEEGDSPAEMMDISLPDFDEVTDIEIIGDNLKAVKAVYFAAMLEEMRMFQVVDKLVELFQYGMLPLGKGEAGRMLYDYWKSSSERITEIERRNLYSRVFGFVGGDPGMGNPNREFNDLMLRFISAVSSYVRQFTVDNLLRSTIAVSINQEQVRKAGRDLAANLSLHGYGIAFFFATELRNQINMFKKLLSDKEIKNAYGARDMWQVIEQVSTLELGGARNVMRYRTMAQSGAVIMAWLAKNAEMLSAPAHIGLLDLDEIRSPISRSNEHKPTEDPTDVDLLNACEQWLAVTGTSDQRVEEYAQPNEGPIITSRPIQIPSAARDLLESVGVRTASYPGNGNGNGNGYGRH